MNLARRLSTFCYRLVSVRVWLGTVVVFGLFLVLVLPAVSEQTRTITGTHETPDTSFWYSPADLYRLAELYGPEGRAYYVRSRFTFDLVWPLVYLSFLAASLTLLYRAQRPNGLRLANAIPFAAVVFDLFENVSVSWIMVRFPAEAAFAASLAPLFTTTKWLFIGLSFAFLVWGLILQVKPKTELTGK